jgi:DNA-binding CsgD family transcriptional regulator
MTDMANTNFDYCRVIHFYETFKSRAFRDINPDDPIISSLEENLNSTGQFFLINDLIELKGVYYSKGAYDFFGIKPGEMNPAVIYEAVHPDDIIRFSNARAKLIKLGMDIFNNQQESMCLSSNFRLKNFTGKYIDLLFQNYVCLNETPHKTAYAIQVNTNITGMIKIRHGYHYYVGTDLSYFRYPDKDYLKTGNIFSDREWEIIMLIANGLESDQIAEKLFLSIHTINRHRQNILNKTGKRTTHDLVIELQERGLI